MKYSFFLFSILLFLLNFYRPNEAPMPIDSAIQEHENNRRKRGSGTKVNGAAASAKSISKNTGGNKKNFR